MAEPYDPNKDAQEFFEHFSRFVNNMNRDSQGVAVEMMLRDHRTLQQNYMRFFMRFVAGMATQESDFRNESAVKMAKAILAGDAGKIALPSI